MDNKLKMGVGLGGPSIIMIFVILCLATLSALTLMTVNADWKLTKKASEQVTSYYAADSEAEEILASADASLLAGHPIEADTFTISVSEKQDIIMKLESNGVGYRVVSRKLVTSEPWDYDQYKTEFDDTITD